jgi:hypothetical protein
MKQCRGCQRLTDNGECAVLNPKPKSCWAWTDDTNWHRKVREDTKKYKQYKNYKIGKYWRDDA